MTWSHVAVCTFLFVVSCDIVFEWHTVSAYTRRMIFRVQKILKKTLAKSSVKEMRKQFEKRIQEATTTNTRENVTQAKCPNYTLNCACILNFDTNLLDSLMFYRISNWTNKKICILNSRSKTDHDMRRSTNADVFYSVLFFHFLSLAFFPIFSVFRIILRVFHI